MTDILKRLRHQQAASERGEPSSYTIDIWRCAADEIERLQGDALHLPASDLRQLRNLARLAGIDVNEMICRLLARSLQEIYPFEECRPEVGAPGGTQGTSTSPDRGQ